MFFFWFVRTILTYKRLGNSDFYFSRSNLFRIFSSNRHFYFSRMVYYVLKTDTGFPEGFIKQTRFFKEGLSGRRTDLIISSIEQIVISQTPFLYIIVLKHIYEFSRSLYFLIEQILIFKEALSSPQTHIIFPETPYASNR